MKCILHSYSIDKNKLHHLSIQMVSVDALANGCQNQELSPALICCLALQVKLAKLINNPDPVSHLTFPN